MDFRNFTQNLFRSRRWTFERVALWALLGSPFLAALIILPSTPAPFISTKVFVLALGAFAALIFFVLARLTRGELTAPPLLLLLSLWLVPFAYGLSTLFSGAPSSVSLFGHVFFDTDTLGFMLVVSLLGTLAALVIRRTGHYRAFMCTSAAFFGAILLAQAFIMLIGNIAPSIVNPGFSLIGSFSDLAIVLGLGIAMTLIWTRFRRVSRLTGRILAFLGIVAFFFLVLANDPVTWALIALVALGLFVEGIMRRTFSSHGSDALLLEEEDEGGDYRMEVSFEESDEETAPATRVAISLTVLVISVFFLFGGSLVSGVLGNSVHVGNLTVHPSWQSTLAVGKATYHTSAIFGSGPNTFGSQFLLYRGANANATPFWNTDFISGVGFIPTSFVTTGIIGALAWIAFFGLFLFFGIRAFVTREIEDPFVRAVALTAFVGMFFILLELVFNVSGPLPLALGFILAGVFASTLRAFYPERQRGVIFSENPRIGFVVVFILTISLFVGVAALYTTVGRYVSQISFVQAEADLSAGSLAAAQNAVNQSLISAPTADAYRLAAVIGMAQVNNFIQRATSTADINRNQLQAILSQSIAAAQAATHINPHAYQNWVALGSVYSSVVPLQVPGAYDAAIKAYDKAQSLNPTSPLIPFALAQTAIANKSYTDAEKYLTETVSLKQDYTPAILELAQVEAQLGKAKKALKAAEAAAYFIPNNPTILFQVGVLRLETNDLSGAVQALTQAVALNKSYANARYFLAAAYANLGNYKAALEQIKAIAALSPQNARIVAAVQQALEKNKNPFTLHTIGTPLQATPSTPAKK